MSMTEHQIAVASLAHIGWTEAMQTLEALADVVPHGEVTTKHIERLERLTQLFTERRNFGLAEKRLALQGAADAK